MLKLYRVRFGLKFPTKLILPSLSRDDRSYLMLMLENEPLGARGNHFLNESSYLNHVFALLFD
ncbi:Hypothetical predicted protein [Olea europaea subsp. europaea]|uniref:Uncharacterized protein n=1 Tax=Olea europaea subsp. europaea TaxID=158383 RepID=A0A8S0Q254_OLEEU|nr:Hypothetical predicted protein [Olea europaea subsp. europaea]